MSARLKDLKKGDYFTKKDISEPTENQVFVRGEYCRDVKKFLIYRFSDVNDYQLMKGDKEVYTEFVF